VSNTSLHALFRVSLYRSFALAFFLALLMCTTPAVSNAEEEPAPEDCFFQDIPCVVTPARIPQKPWHAPSLTEVVTAQDIERWGARSVADVLRRIAGIDVRQFGKGYMVGPRGTANVTHITNVLVLLDGIPVNDPIFGTFDLGPNFPLAFIKQIEVVRGPGSCLYGANAYSGVINIITKRATDAGTNRLQADLGPDRSLGTSLVFANPTLDGGISAGLRGYFTDGRERNAVNGNDWLHVRNAYAAVRTGRTEILAMASDASEGRPLDRLDADPTDFVEQGRYNLHASHRLLDRPKEDLVFKLHTDRSEGSFPGGGDYGPGPRPGRIGFSAAHSGLDLEFTHEINSRRTVVTGLEYVEKHADWYDIDGVRKSHERAFYFQEQRKSGKLWTFTLGSRLDDNSIYGTMISPRIAALKELKEGQTFRLSIERAYRAPNFSEQYIDTPIGSIDLAPIPLTRPIIAKGNLALEPESVISYQASLDLRPRLNHRVQFSVFWKRAKDRIGSEFVIPTVLDLNSIFEVRPINEGKSTTRGGEFTVTFDERHGARFSMNYSYQSAHDGETGMPLEYVPRHKVNLGFDSRTDRPWSYSCNLHVVSSRQIKSLVFDSSTFTLVPHLERVGGFGTLDARVARRIDSSSELALRGYNLLDAHYVETSLYPMPRRTIVLEYIHRF